MTNAEVRFNKSLRPRKPEGSLGRTAQDVHLDSHTAPELWRLRGSSCIITPGVVCELLQFAATQQAGIVNFFVDHTHTQFSEESKMASELTPQTDVTSVTLHKIKSIKNPIKQFFSYFLFYFIKSETSDSFVNHFDGHYAYLKTLDFYFKDSFQQSLPAGFCYVGFESSSWSGPATITPRCESDVRLSVLFGLVPCDLEDGLLQAWREWS